MSAFLPAAPRRTENDREGTTLLDLRRQRAWVEQRWQLRAAQWRAMDLAESVFGGRVRVHVDGALLEGPFRALLHIEVPFEGLRAHREREAVFTSAAGRDPVLTRVPLVYVFSAAVP